MDIPTPSNEMLSKQAELAARVKKLEDAVFGDGPGFGDGAPGPGGGPPGLNERLKTLADELTALQMSSMNRTNELDRKIDDVIRIVAELRNIIAQTQKAKVMKMLA
jgi:hypothetical protein